MPWFDDLTVDCFHGNILEADTEAIACNVNVMVNLNYSLGKQLLQHYGPRLLGRVDESRKQLNGGQLELGQAIWVDVSNCNSVRGIIFFGWWAEDNDFTSQLIYKCFTTTLRTAFANDCRSIAFPLFGSGSGNMNFQVFQKTIWQALFELNKLKDSGSFSVQELLFFSTDQRLLSQLDNYLARLFI